MNETLKGALQVTCAIAAFFILIYAVLFLSMTFGPPQAQLPNATCNIVDNTTFCHF